ncbi:hypothetical protein AB1328_02375 [Streptomyces virginiae]
MALSCGMTLARAEATNSWAGSFGPMPAAARENSRSAASRSSIRPSAIRTRER